jgi:hypothetical protein
VLSAATRHARDLCLRGLWPLGGACHIRVLGAAIHDITALR